MKRTFLNLKYMKIQLCDRKDEFLIFSHRLETIKYEKMMFKSLPKKNRDGSVILLSAKL